jgi:hypothetical protein
VQLSAAGDLTVTGTIRANGGDGDLPCGANDEGGGTGGGSGGGILLEGASLTRQRAILQVNGGNGGPDGDYFHCGGNTGAQGSTSASNPGDDGRDCSGGSPGGGGGYGRVEAFDR